MKGLTLLWLPTLPNPTPSHLPTHPLQYAIHDITVIVKKVAQNPAVLAG